MEELEWSSVSCSCLMPREDALLTAQTVLTTETAPRRNQVTFRDFRNVELPLVRLHVKGIYGNEPAQIVVWPNFSGRIGVFATDTAVAPRITMVRRIVQREGLEEHVENGLGLGRHTFEDLSQLDWIIDMLLAWRAYGVNYLNDRGQPNLFFTARSVVTLVFPHRDAPMRPIDRKWNLSASHRDSHSVCLTGSYVFSHPSLAT